MSPTDSRGESSGIPADVSGLLDDVLAKALAEVDSAESILGGGTPSHGDLTAQTMLVKGAAGPAEEAGGPALSGEDGVAVRKAIAALGLQDDRLYSTMSRPVVDCTPDAVVARLRALVVAVDPEIIIALDETASSDLKIALELPDLKSGDLQMWHGVVVLSVEGFERSLGDAGLKRRVWSQMQALQGALKVRI